MGDGAHEQFVQTEKTDEPDSSSIHSYTNMAKKRKNKQAPAKKAATAADEVHGKETSHEEPPQTNADPLASRGTASPEEAGDDVPDASDVEVEVEVDLRSDEPRRGSLQGDSSNVADTVEHTEDPVVAAHAASNAGSEMDGLRGPGTDNVEVGLGGSDSNSGGDVEVEDLGIGEDHGPGTVTSDGAPTPELLASPRRQSVSTPTTRAIPLPETERVFPSPDTNDDEDIGTGLVRVDSALNTLPTLDQTTEALQNSIPPASAPGEGQRLSDGMEGLDIGQTEQTFEDGHATEYDDPHESLPVAISERHGSDGLQKRVDGQAQPVEDTFLATKETVISADDLEEPEHDIAETSPSGESEGHTNGYSDVKLDDESDRSPLSEQVDDHTIQFSNPIIPSRPTTPERESSTPTTYSPPRPDRTPSVTSRDEPQADHDSNGGQIEYDGLNHQQKHSGEYERNHIQDSDNALYSHKPTLPASAPISLVVDDNTDDVTAQFESIPISATSSSGPSPSADRTLSPVRPGNDKRRSSWGFNFGRKGSSANSSVEGAMRRTSSTSVNDTGEGSGVGERAENGSKSSLGQSFAQQSDQSTHAPDQPIRNGEPSKPRRHAPPAHPFPFPIPSSPKRASAADQSLEHDTNGSSHPEAVAGVPAGAVANSSLAPAPNPPRISSDIKDHGIGVKGVSALEKVMNHTRPAHLPPKPKEEDDTHYHQWEEMMATAREHEKAARKIADQRRAERERKLVANTPRWERLLADPGYSNSNVQRNSELRRMWFEGVPTYLRGKAWSLAIGNPLARSKGEFEG